MNEYIVINAEVRIVMVFVLTSDLDDAAVGQEGEALSKTVRAPDGLLA